ncbi:MAG: YfaZ family protein [Gammaproteobacteria bacterium]|nr:YfaZ family protein [Gammaproteobacteria bacterium]MCW8923135.1 YfaZ family protein [Gammaproteobacteria bacterium]
MLHRALILILALAPFSTAMAAAIDFRLGSEMAEVIYKTQDADFGYGGADIGLGILLNDEDDLLATGSILVSGSNEGNVRGLHFGVGAKIFAGILDFPSPVDNQTGASLAIGAQVRYVFPGKMPMAILLEGFAAPDVTSLSDFKGTQEIRLAVELEITPSARAYIGYRKLEVELSDGLLPRNEEYEVDDKAHVGVRFSF